MFLESFPSRGAAAESGPSPQTAVIRAGEALAGLETEYAEAIAGLPGNDKPYATIGSLTNRVQEYFKAQILPLKQNRAELPPDLREEADELIRRSSRLYWRSHYLVTQIDRLLEITGEDGSLFAIDLEAHVSREEMHDGAVEMHSRILLPSVPPEDVIALVEPLGFERALPFYALKNQLTGKRRVRLEKVTSEGDFYCSAAEPNKEEVLRYYKDLRSRMERINTFKGLEDLLCECRGLMEYLEETQSYSELAEDVAKLHQYVNAKGLYLFSKEKGRIEKFTSADSPAVLEGIDCKIAKAIMANRDPKIMLSTSDGGALMVFSVQRPVGTQDRILTPLIEPSLSRKNAYALFLDKLFESPESLGVLRSAIKDPFFDVERRLYIISPVGLVRGKWKARLVDRCAAGQLYRISPRENAEFPQMRGSFAVGKKGF